MEIICTSILTFWTEISKLKDQIKNGLQTFRNDNALAENFFSILKTECIYRTKLRSYEETRLLIDEYIYFYNNQRIQLKTKLTPLELQSQYVA